MLKTVTIDQLTDMWDKDSVIDKSDPNRELANVPILHSRYAKILLNHNLIIDKLTIDYNELKIIKLKYYTGKLNNKEDLEKYNLEPIEDRYHRFEKNELAAQLDADRDLNIIRSKINIHKKIVDYCQSVLKEINNRTWQLRSMLDWIKYEDGK